MADLVSDATVEGLQPLRIRLWRRNALQPLVDRIRAALGGRADVRRQLARVGDEYPDQRFGGKAGLRLASRQCHGLAERDSGVAAMLEQRQLFLARLLSELARRIALELAPDFGLDVV